MTRNRSLVLPLVLIALLLGVGITALETTPGDAARKPRRQVTSEIIAGGDVADGTYAFVAAIASADGSGTVRPENVFCGGSLIAPAFVLTAAHCVAGEVPEQLVVVVGRTVLSTQTGEVRRVAAISIHPAYRHKSNDVAVVHLAQPVTTITPVTVVQEGDGSLEGVGASLIVAGWGSQGRHSYAVSDRMRQVQVPVVGDGPCHRQWTHKRNKRGIVPGLLLCTAKSRVGAGDSGGPLFTTVGTTTVQVALVTGGSDWGKAPDYHAQLSAPAIHSFIRSLIGS